MKILQILVLLMNSVSAQIDSDRKLNNFINQQNYVLKESMIETINQFDINDSKD